MSRLLLTLILGGAVAALAYFAVDTHNKQVASLEHQIGAEQLRAAFVERAGFVWSIESPERYVDELTSLVRWYEAERADLHNRYPGHFNPNAALDELDKLVAAGALSASDARARREWYDRTKELYDLILSGRYAPLRTTTINGVRVDLLAFRRDLYEGRSRLRLDVVTWGTPRREQRTSSEGGKLVTRRVLLDLGFQGLDIEMIDATPRLVAGGKTGAPTMQVEYPERWIADFPPQVSYSLWWIDPLPEETETVKLSLSGEIRSPFGGALKFKQDWELAAKDDWRVRDGESFDGEERVLPQEALTR